MWTYNSVADKAFLSLTQRQKHTPGLEIQIPSSLHQELPSTIPRRIIIISAPVPHPYFFMHSQFWLILQLLTLPSRSAPCESPYTPPAPSSFSPFPRLPLLGHLSILSWICPAWSSPDWPPLRASPVTPVTSSRIAHGPLCFQSQLPPPAQWYGKPIKTTLITWTF